MAKIKPAATAKEAIVQALKRKLNYANDVLKKHTEDFAKDPRNALNWAEGTFAAAALTALARKSLLVLERPEVDVETKYLHGVLLKQLRTLSRYPHNSVSPCATLISTCDRVATAEVIEIFEDNISIYT